VTCVLWSPGHAGPHVRYGFNWRDGHAGACCAQVTAPRGPRRRHSSDQCPASGRVGSVAYGRLARDKVHFPFTMVEGVTA